MGTEKKDRTLDCRIVVIGDKGYYRKHLDVFSCKWFDEGIGRDVVNSFFSPEEITEQIILRS